MKKTIFKCPSPIAEKLMHQDPALIPLLSKPHEITVLLEENPFVFLVETIIGQQLSTKAADAIRQRLHERLNNQITPEQILELSIDELRTLGVSGPKINYMQSLARMVINEEIDFKTFLNLKDEEVIHELIKIKGVGVWTAQMYLLFVLNRPDVFSSGDLGLRESLKKLLNKPDMTLKEVEKHSLKWQPYRTFVSHFLWHHWD